MKTIQILILMLLCCATIKAQNKEISQNKDEIKDYPQILISISQLKEQVKLNDSATIRVFLRVEMANLIWKKKVTEGQSLAEDLISEAAEDFHNHLAEIPDFYQNLICTGIVSSLKIYSPKVLSRLSKKYNLEKGSLEQSYSLATNYGTAGMTKAIQDIGKTLNQNSASQKMTLFFTIQQLLSNKKISEANSLLEIVIASEENADEITTKLLLALNGTYLSETTPINLQKRFLNLVIVRGQMLLQNPMKTNEQQLKISDVLSILKYSLSQIEKLLPSNYPQALVLIQALSEKRPKSEKEKEEIYERIAGSADKLQQTISEAKSAEDKNMQEQLWNSAAQLALDEGKFRLATDCIGEAEAVSSDSNFLLWHDQFLDDDVSKSALANSDVESAEYAISRIKSKIRAGTALSKVVKFYHKKKDVVNAQLNLNEAIKKIESAENDSQKVRALCEILYATLAVDKDRFFAVAQSIAKTVNSIPTPNIDDKPESEHRKNYVQNVQMVIIQNIIPAFQALAKHNTPLARNLATDFSQRDYRTVALFAVETETPVLETILPMPKSNLQKNKKKEDSK